MAKPVFVIETDDDGPGERPTLAPVSGGVARAHGDARAVDDVPFSSDLSTFLSDVAPIDGSRHVEALVPSEIERHELLGRGGSGGAVYRCTHRGVLFAVKEVPIVDASAATRRQIARELLILHRARCDAIVDFHGAFFREGHVHILLELMDCGSFDAIGRLVGPLSEGVLAAIAWQVLTAMRYLKDVLHIMHRDIKPGNVLLASSGVIKLCDFSIGGELANSLARTNVGTQLYMAPERIAARADEAYSIKADVWALGLTIVELALAAYPYCAESKRPSLFQYISAIVGDPAPALPPDSSHSPPMRAFLTRTLVKAPDARSGDLNELLRHEWLHEWRAHETLMGEFAADVIQRRRSAAPRVDASGTVPATAPAPRDAATPGYAGAFVVDADDDLSFIICPS